MGVGLWGWDYGGGTMGLEVWGWDYGAGLAVGLDVTPATDVLGGLKHLLVRLSIPMRWAMPRPCPGLNPDAES